MKINFRNMVEADRECVKDMMRVFYSSDAVHTNGSDEIFDRDLDACVGSSPYLEGYIIELDGKTVGYGMLAKSFSTEYGVPCIWIEDIYLMECARGKGIGPMFIRFIEDKYKGHILRLEAEEENLAAVRAYRKCGFDTMPYLEMKKLT